MQWVGCKKDLLVQEKKLKQQLQDEVAKAIITNGAPLSISEHEAIVSEIKRKAAEALSEMTEAKGMAFKSKLRISGFSSFKIS